ncbi:hypothetical protein [Actinoplanes sp. NPDC026619]|uniref:hypothetical protein n=1 Tax=Actinoplanes sp. NPDC026619 TaxID=3155798 RepID=UPI0033D08573
MSFLNPGAAWTHQPATYLVLAAVCLLIILRFLKRAMAPMSGLIRAATAAAVVAFAAVLALAMLVLAAFTSAR